MFELAASWYIDMQEMHEERDKCQIDSRLQVGIRIDISRYENK